MMIRVVLSTIILPTWMFRSGNIECDYDVPENSKQASHVFKLGRHLPGRSLSSSADLKGVNQNRPKTKKNVAQCDVPESSPEPGGQSF